MVRECRPPAREPVRSWLARRSTMATSTPANASSPANISPVGPPPAIVTACSVIATLRFGTGLTTSPPVRYILKRGGQDETASIDDGLLVVSSRKAAPMLETVEGCPGPPRGRGDGDGLGHRLRGSRR